jgi:hypothetical protein
VYVPFVLDRTESIFAEISFRYRRRDDEDLRFVRLSLVEIPSNRGKAQRSDTLKTLECVKQFTLASELERTNDGQDANRRTIVARCFHVLSCSPFSPF